MATIKQKTKTTTTYKYRKSQGNSKHCPVCGKFMTKGKTAKKK